MTLANLLAFSAMNSSPLRRNLAEIGEILSINRSLYGAARVRVNVSLQKGSIVVIAGKRRCPATFQVSFFKDKYPLSRPKMSPRISGIHLRTALPRIGHAPRGFTVGEGTLAAASPQTPWLRGETDSALRLVTLLVI
jgi:hypothetical protein